MMNQNSNTSQGDASRHIEFSQGQISKDTPLHSAHSVHFVMQEKGSHEHRVIPKPLTTNHKKKRRDVIIPRIDSSIVRPCIKKHDKCSALLNTQEYTYLLKLEKLKMDSLASIMLQFIDGSFGAVKANIEADNNMIRNTMQIIKPTQNS